MLAPFFPASPRLSVDRTGWGDRLRGSRRTGAAGNRVRPPGRSLAPPRRCASPGASGDALAGNRSVA